MPNGHGDAQRAKLGQRRRIGAVIAGHAHTAGMQQPGDGAHAGAADAHDVDFLVEQIHRFNYLVSICQVTIVMLMRQKLMRSRITFNSHISSIQSPISNLPTPAR